LGLISKVKNAKEVERSQKLQIWPQQSQIGNTGEVLTRKKIREQAYYYETIAMLIPIGKRLGQRPSRKY